MYGAAPVQCSIRPSASLAAFLFLGHLSALAVAVCVPVPSLLQWGLAFAVLLSLLYFFRWYRQPSIIGLKACGDGRLQIELAASGEPVDVMVSAQTVVLPWLILLRVQFPKPFGERSLVLPRDRITPADAHRRLRRWLLWGQQQGKASRPPGGA